MKSFYFKIFSIILISCIGFIVYSNTFHCTLHFDDEFLLIDNLALRNISNLQNIWNFLPCRFIFYLSLALNYHFHQLDVFGYHVVNLALHLGSAILVWWLTILTLSAPVFTFLKKNTITKHANLIALFAGLVFVSHPLQTQAVTYIVQRAAAMATLFYVATLCLYAKARLHMMDSELLRVSGMRTRFRGNDNRREGNDNRREGNNKNNDVIPAKAGIQFRINPDSLGRVYYTAALLTAMMAMFSKEIAITLPLMIFLYEFTFFRRDAINGVSTNWKYLSPFLLTIFIIPLTMFLNKSHQAINSVDLRNAIEGTTKVSSTDYLFTQFRVMVTYIRLIFLPLNQNLDYDYPISKSIFELPVFFSLLFLIIVLYWAKRLFSKYRLISFSVFWFFLCLLPESSIFPINEVIFEHRLYLPLVGYSIFLVSGLYYIFGKNNIKALVIVLSMIIVCNSILTYQRNKVWRDELTLLNDIVRKSPHKARPHNNLGNVYLKEAKFTQAIIEFNRAIELDQNYAEPLVNRGLIRDKEGNLALALSDYNKAIEANPHFVGAYNNRGSTYTKQGNYAQAISDYTKAIKLNTNETEAYYNRGIVYNNQGNFTQAISDFTKAITLNPKLSEAYSSRGIAYAVQSNITQAMLDLNKAIEINPKLAEAYNSRGSIYYKQGSFTPALSDFTKVIEINPNYAQGYNNRGLTYNQQKNFTQAISDFTKAIEINPKYADAYNNRSFIYGNQGNFTQALSDCNEAIELNPQFAPAYNNRAITRYQLKEYDKAWGDVRKAEKLGYSVNPDFIKILQIETGQDK